MNSASTASSTRSDARLAGLLYLIPMFLGPFSMMYVPSVIVAPGDAATTMAQLLASESLFRIGMLSDALIVLSELALTAVLYFLLRPAGRTLALTAMLARLGMTVLQAANLLPELAALELAHAAGTSAAGGIEPGQAAELVLFSLRLHDLAALVWQILFGLHCAVVGVLVFRSGFFPRVLGALMAIAAVGYTLNGLGNLVLPSSAPTFAAIVGLTALVGEVPFVFWLLIKGVDEARWQAEEQRSR